MCSFFFKFIYFEREGCREREREREKMWAGEGQKERISGRLRAVSIEPDARLEPKSRVRHLTEPPRCPCVRFFFLITINYHKYSGSKQHTNVLSYHFHGSGVEAGPSWEALFRVSHGYLSSRCQTGRIFIYSLKWAKPTSKHSQVIDRIYFLVVVWLRALGFAGWLPSVPCFLNMTAPIRPPGSIFTHAG